jgi:uncharacterized membrane protein
VRADPDPLAVTADALKLHALAAAGLIDGRALTWGLAQIGHRPTADSWYRFARVQLLLLGASLVAVGTGFFVAANWDELSAYTRMGMIAALMAAVTLLAARLGLHSLSGRVAALLGGLGFGPLMALVGQTYQTGADAWELFLAWTLVLSVYALVIRFAGAWVTAIVLAHVTTFFWAYQSLAAEPFEGVGLVITTTVSLLGWCVAVALALAPGHERRTLVINFLLTVAQLLALAVGSAAIVQRGLAGPLQFALLWPLLLAGLGVWLFARVRPDLARVRGSVLVAAGLLAVAEGKLIFDVWDMRESGLLLMGTLLILQGWQFGRWILRLRLHEEAQP